MALTPEDVRNKEFRNSFRGYNEPEVDAFLDEVEAELVRLLQENAELRERAQLAAAAASATAPQSLERSPMGETEEMLRRTLLIAQRTADETVAEAKVEADRIVAAAQEHTRALLGQAQQQAASRITELEQRRQALEQHIEGLRAFEREYRTRLKAYLEAQLRDLDVRAGGPPPAAAPASAPAFSAAEAHAQQPQAQPPQSALPPAAPQVAAPPATDTPGGFVRRQPPAPGDVPRPE